MINQREDDIDNPDLALALRRLAGAIVVPPADPAREAALMAAFDATPRAAPAVSRRQYLYMAGLATAATVLLATGLDPGSTGRHGSPPGALRATHTVLVPNVRDVQPGPPNEFVMVPGAAGLPELESGSLVRMDVPVSMLPSLGLTPPQANRTTAVKADLIIGQDGLTRAVRLVN
jgi:hypothetical protein